MISNLTGFKGDYIFFLFYLIYRSAYFCQLWFLFTSAH